jgi:hypothetical protein
MTWFVAVSALALAYSAPTMAGSPDAGTDRFFETNVRPVLAGTCVKCHGEKKASGGLRLDSREAVLKGGETGPAVVPGDPKASLLVQAIRHSDDTLKMPPNKPLPRSVQDDLASWIAAGAPWPQFAARPISGHAHWAFEPLQAVVPPVDPSGWASQPIDRFISAGHRANGLHPVSRADRRTLIRRATFDLIGLPPEPQRVEAFVTDERPDPFARLVDELLARSWPTSASAGC